MLRRIGLVSRFGLFSIGVLWLLLLLLSLVIHWWYRQAWESGILDIGVVAGSLSVNVWIDEFEYVDSPYDPPTLENDAMLGEPINDPAETGFEIDRNDPFLPPWRSPWPLIDREVYSFGRAFSVSLPLWLLAAVCLAWPVTSFLVRRRRRGRGFEVEAKAARDPAADPPDAAGGRG